MRYDWEMVLHNLLGKPMEEVFANPGGEPEKRVVTLGRACLKALLVTLEGDTANGEEKFRRYKLAQLIEHGTNGGETDVTAEDVVLIKKMVGRVYPTYTSGLIWSILEGEDS
jgi:hypothetical protein